MLWKGLVADCSDILIWISLFQYMAHASHQLLPAATEMHAHAKVDFSCHTSLQFLKQTLTLLYFDRHRNACTLPKWISAATPLYKS